MLTVRDVIAWIEKTAPIGLAAPWDHVGLQAGNPDATVTGVYTALDPTEAIVELAIAKGCNLLLTHHPLYLKPPSRFDFSRGAGRVLALALENKLSIYAAHTNLDAAKGGLNDVLCDRLGLTDRVPLEPTPDPSVYFKLIAYVPATHTAQVLEALFAAGAGHIGDYAKCSYRSPGTGTFVPLPGSDPFIGETCKFTEVSEERVEVIVPQSRLIAVERALAAAHPYEEPAFDWFALSPRAVSETGIGRVGNLARAMPVKAYLDELKTRLRVKQFRFIGPLSGKIRKIALCSGSGASFIKTAAAAGADLYITGDVKYHDALDAEALGLRVADLGHFATEHWAIDLLAQMVQKELDRSKLSKIKIHKDRFGRDPFIHMG